ncbi:MAG: hypothetical protein HQM08_16095 [Candidatus Riflebacteria bacterium]|nr:hypothetical protein [Candidatus Riflebacteria bacterium]
MKRSIILLVAVYLISASGLFGAESPSGSNAALSYLLAVGNLNPMPDSVNKELTNCVKPDDLEKISMEAKLFLTEGKNQNILRMLRAGGSCQQCTFCPDNKGDFDDIVPPYKLLRQLGGYAGILGLLSEKEGNPKEALEIYLDIFRLGKHIEENGCLIDGMVALGICKKALPLLKSFKEKHPEPEWQEKIKSFFSSSQRPTINIVKFLESEKKVTMNTLGRIKENSPLLRSFAKEIITKALGDKNVVTSCPVLQNISEKLPAPDSTKESAEKACKANQRVLTGAMEMLMMDYQTLPASATSNLMDFLVKEKYLKSAPTCPKKGEYKIEFNTKHEPLVYCTTHQIQLPKLSALQEEIDPAMEELIKNFVQSPEFSKYVDGMGKIYDEVLGLDLKAPDFQNKLKELSEKIKNSANPIIQIATPNFSMAFSKQLEFQKEIDDLIK